MIMTCNADIVNFIYAFLQGDENAFKHTQHILICGSRGLLRK